MEKEKEGGLFLASFLSRSRSSSYSLSFFIGLDLRGVESYFGGALVGRREEGRKGGRERALLPSVLRFRFQGGKLKISPAAAEPSDPDTLPPSRSATRRSEGERHTPHVRTRGGGDLGSGAPSQTSLPEADHPFCSVAALRKQLSFSLAWWRPKIAAARWVGDITRATANRLRIHHTCELK